MVKVERMPYYAVARGRSKGIYLTWAECESQVKGYSGARYKKFDSVSAAEDFINSAAGNSAPSKSKNTYKTEYNLNSALNVYSKQKYNNPSNSGQSNYNRVPTRQYSTSKRDDDAFSDESDDDLNSIAIKQLDDVERRLKSFSKGVDNIIKKSSRKRTILIDPPQSKKSKNSHEFQEDSDGYVIVYTDGACSSNGRSGARAGLGVYWGDGHPLNTCEPVSGRATNNCGEIQGATRAIELALKNGITKLTINTDSQFLINSVTKWMPGWKQKGWRLKSGDPVKNEKDFKELDRMLPKLDVKWNYIEAHRGVHGNEMADQLAKAGAAMYKSGDNR